MSLTVNISIIGFKAIYDKIKLNGYTFDSLRHVE